jgi:hypothetical protein
MTDEQKEERILKIQEGTLILAFLGLIVAILKK